MQYFLIFLMFCLGTIFGSFYNVMIDRLPNDEDIFVKKSSCGCCHHTLKWYDMVPIISYIMLLGRCRYCKSKLSPQYLISEIFTGCLFAFAMWFYTYNDLLSVFIAIFFFSMLYVVAMIDFKNKIIIDQVVIGFTIPGVILKVVKLIVDKENILNGLLQMFLGGLAGFVLYFIIYLLTKLILKKEGFGQGDIVLLTGIGLFLDYKQTLAVGILAFYVGFIFLIVGLIIKKIKNKKTVSNKVEAVEEEKIVAESKINNEEEIVNDAVNEDSISVFETQTDAKNELNNENIEEEPEEEENSSIEIPFGPSICIVAFVFLLYGNQILNAIFKLMGF